MTARTLLLQGLLPLRWHSKQTPAEGTGLTLKEGSLAIGAELFGNVEQGEELGSKGNILVLVI